VLENVHLHSRPVSQAAGYQVAIGVVLCLFFGDGAQLDLFGNPRVVVGDLCSRPVADQVGAAVPDVGDQDSPLVHHSRHQRGAHTRLRVDRARLLVDAEIGFCYGAFQADRGGERELVLVIVLLVERFYRQATGNLAGGVAAHPVRHDQ